MVRRGGGRPASSFPLPSLRPEPASSRRCPCRQQTSKASGTSSRRKDSVSDAEQQGLRFVSSAAPVLDNKARRRAHASKQRRLSRAELVNAGNGQNGCTDYPGIRGQPIKLT